MDRDAELYQSLADSTRLRLINLLDQAGEICVCELADALAVPQYSISRHLQLLVRAGWLEDRKLGKWVYYRIARQLRPAQRTLLQAVRQLRTEREDFKQDERRGSRRLRLRRGGVCCVGLVSRIGEAVAARTWRRTRGLATS